jgi:hypothetical protein
VIINVVIASAPRIRRWEPSPYFPPTWNFNTPTPTLAPTWDNHQTTNLNPAPNVNTNAAPAYYFYESESHIPQPPDPHISGTFHEWSTTPTDPDPYAPMWDHIGMYHTDIHQGANPNPNGTFRDWYLHNTS